MADAPKILATDKLNQAFPKLNKGIDNANEALKKSTNAETKSDKAVATANTAKQSADSTRTELNAIVGRETDSDAMSRQAAVNADGQDKGNLKARLDDDYNKVTTRLDETAQDITVIKGDSINPDDYNGTDAQKLQTAIDTCIASRGSSYIELKRIFNITGETVKINKGDVRYPVLFRSGGFRKDDSGHMISGDMMDASDIYFDHVFFQSIEGAGTIAFDTEKLIRLHTTGCNFKDVDQIAKSVNRWAQSIRSKNDTITGGVGYAYDLQQEVYDTIFDNLTLEKRQSGIKLGDCHSVRIVNSVLEGLSGTAIKVLIDCTNLTIDGNYFEQNMQGNIDLSEMSNAKGLSITSNVLLGDTSANGQTQTLIKWGNKVSQANTELNWCAAGRVHDASILATGYVNSKNDFAYIADLVKNENSIRYFDVVKTKTYSPGRTKSFIGEFSRLTAQKTLSLAAKEWQLVSMDFNEPVYTDDLISIQLFTGASGASQVIVGHYYKGDNNRVYFWVKNEHDVAVSNIVATVTVLKMPYSIIG